MAYASWSVVFNEQPSASKWNILGTNDASFNDGTGFATGAIGSTNAALAPGIVCQVVGTNYSAVSTGSTDMPYDDSIPQNTEGDEYMSQAITPKATTNILVIEVVATLSRAAANGRISGALFQDSTANALAATEIYIGAATSTGVMTLRHVVAAGTTSSTTFKFRAGEESGGGSTITFNGSSGARKFGAITKSSIVIWEYKAS